MKKLSVVMILAMTLFAIAASAASIQGTIADANCAAKQGAKAAGEGHMNCAEKCIKGGAQAVLITPEGKVYKLDDQKKAAEHAGHKVTVNGTVNGDTINVESISM